jgi:hypothetical protein
VSAGVVTGWPRFRCFGALRPSFAPSSLAFVMATGIVSTAASSLHLATAAWTQFQLDKAAYAALLLHTFVRVVGIGRACSEP